MRKAHLAFEGSDDVELEITARHLTEPQRKHLDTQVPPIDLTEPQEKLKKPRAMRGSFVAQQSGNYHIHITDVEGFTNRDPINYTLTVFRDAVPDVNIVSPARDTVLDNAMLVELEVEAADDYGIQELQLVYHVEAEGAEEMNIPLKRWDCPERTRP